MGNSTQQAQIGTAEIPPRTHRRYVVAGLRPDLFRFPGTTGRIQGTAARTNHRHRPLGQLCAYALFKNTDPTQEELAQLTREMADHLIDCLQEEPKDRPPECFSLGKHWNKLSETETPAATVLATASSARLEGPVGTCRHEQATGQFHPDNRLYTPEPRRSRCPACRKRAESLQRDDEEEPVSRRLATAEDATSDNQSTQRRRLTEEDEEEDTPHSRRSASGSSNTGLLVGRVVLVLLIAGGLIYCVVIKKQDKDFPSITNNQQVADNNQNKEGPKEKANKVIPAINKKESKLDFSSIPAGGNLVDLSMGTTGFARISTRRRNRKRSHWMSPNTTSSNGGHA